MNFEFTPSTETRIMDSTNKPRFSNTLLIAATSSLPVGAAMAQGGPTGGEMTGNGHWYGTGGVWLPVLAIVVVGAVLFAVLRRKQ
jgi:hypothetical protein